MDRRLKRELMSRLERDAGRIASQFGLRYRALEAERANVTSRYGVCYSDGTVRIRLRHVTTGKPLKYSSLVNTLCHELAHLRHFNHGPRFKAFYLQILGWCRAQGIYRPRAAAPASTLREDPKTQLPTGSPIATAGRATARSTFAAPKGPTQLELF